MKKMKSKLIAFTLLSTLVFQSVTFAETTDTVDKTKISINELVTTTDITPVEKDGKIFVAMKDVLGVNLNVETSWHEPSKTVTVKRGENMLFQITPGKASIFVEGKLQNLDATPYIENDVIMIPLDILETQLGVTAEYDKEQNTVTIVSDNNKESNSDTLSQRGGTPITFDEAVEKAMVSSSSVKNLKDNRDVMEYHRDQLSQRYATYYASDNSVIYGDTSQITDVVDLMQTDNSLESLQYQEEILEGSIKASIKSVFNNIIGYEEDLAYKKLSIEHNKKLLDIAKRKVELGMLSQYEYDKQEKDYKQELIDVSTLESNIENEYKNLGILLDSNEKYVISYEIPEYRTIGDVNVSTYANQHQYNNPSIKIKELAVENARQQLRVVSTTGEAYKTNYNKYTQAEREFEDSKSEFEKKVLNTYNSIKSTEDDYEKALKDLEQYKKDYEVLKVKFNSGLASAIEIDTMSFNIASQEYKIKKLAIGLDSAKYTFERPYLL